MKNKTQNQLSREAIYQEEFRETLTDDEVQEIAMRLLCFFGILNKRNPGSVDASNLPR